MSGPNFRLTGGGFARFVPRCMFRYAGHAIPQFAAQTARRVQVPARRAAQAHMRGAGEAQQATQAQLALSRA
jgi:hypothetical protein